MKNHGWLGTNHQVVMVMLCIALAPSTRAEVVLEGLKVLNELQKAVGNRATTTKQEAPPPEEKSEPADPAYAHTLRFLNGDALHGRLDSIDPQTGVRWKTPDAKNIIEFASTKLFKIILPQAQLSTNKPSEQSCVLKLTNGDELCGDLVSVDDQTVVMDTAYAGTMTFQRKKVSSLLMVKTGTAPLFEGPVSSEGWTLGRGRTGWKYSDGSFSTTRPSLIGRDLKLPPAARLEFDLAWRGPLQFMVSLYSDGFEEYGNNAYMLQLNSGYAYLQRIRKNAGGHNMGQTEATSMFSKSRAHVEILCNKEAKTIALVVDGAMVKQWKDNQDWVAGGTTVLFIQQTMSYARLSNIRVTEWDGKFDDSIPGAKAKDDQVELFNRDKISGDLKNIKDGKVLFNTAFANMDIPLGRVQRIELAGSKAEVAEAKASDLRAVFVGRGSVTLALEKWADGAVLAASPNFGKAKFLANAFNQVQFNLEQVKKIGKGMDAIETDDGEIQ